MKAKDTLLLNKTTTQNPILGEEPAFGMLHHIYAYLCKLDEKIPFFHFILV